MAEHHGCRQFGFQPAQRCEQLEALELGKTSGGGGLTAEPPDEFGHLQEALFAPVGEGDIDCDPVQPGLGRGLRLPFRP